MGVKGEVKDPDEGEEGGDTPGVPAEPVEYTYDFSEAVEGATTPIDEFLEADNVTVEGTFGDKVKYGNGHLKFSSDSGKLVITVEAKAGQTVTVTSSVKSGSSNKPVSGRYAVTNATTDDEQTISFEVGSSSSYVDFVAEYTVTADGNVVITIDRNECGATLQLASVKVVVE